jgi:putative radical SAM enzyme (TIGR03279 family)
LYISVHALQPQVRSMLMGNQRAGRIRQDLLRLSQAGIQVHTQIVLCPGLNDGQVLEETIEGLAELYPSVSSIGIVPVGLTGHRSSLPELRTLNELEALSLIELIHSYQKRFRTQLGYGLVYGADEIYLKAGQPLPDRQYYDDFPQVENGIGIGRLFLDDFAEEESNLPIEIEECEVYILTGQSALKIWEEIVSRLNRIQGLRLHLLPVRNVYFGGQVTVTGLLTGQDIIKALGQDYIGKTILIPEIIFKEGQDILLDDITLEDIKKASGAELKPVEVNASALIEAILGEKY